MDTTGTSHTICVGLALIVMALVLATATVHPSAALAQTDVTSEYEQAAPAPQLNIGTAFEAGGTGYAAARADLRLLRVRRAQGLVSLSLAIMRRSLPTRISCHRAARLLVRCSFAIVLPGGSAWAGTAKVQVIPGLGRVSVEYSMEG